MVLSNQGQSGYAVGAVRKFFLMLTFVVRIQSNLSLTTTLDTDGSYREVSDRSRGGARVPGPPLFWVKKEEITGGRKSGTPSKTTLPHPLAQCLDVQTCYQ